MSVYTPAVALYPDSTYNFEEWFLELDADDAVDKAVKEVKIETAEMVANEIFANLVLHIESGGAEMGQAVVSTEAAEDHYFAFDLEDAIKTAVWTIEINMNETHPDYAEETREHLLAFRAKIASLLNIIDAAPLLKDR